MKIRSLNADDNFKSISNWLNINLKFENSIIPIPSQLEIVPLQKGIYFWLIRKDGYKALSGFCGIHKLLDCYEYDFKGVKYDLVYIGTAGTGKNGKSNLRERLNWHISQTHSQGTVCHGTLSTLRSGIGSLVSDDLILNNTEQLINEVFENYFKILFIPYEGASEKNIDNDEYILINKLRPLFNLKNNPNAKSSSIDNPSKQYRTRRNEVINNSKNRLGCKNKELANTMKTVKKRTEDSVLYDQVYENDESGSTLYYVLVDQNIAEVTRGIDGLHEGEVKIDIWNSNDENQRFDLIKFKTPTTGRGNQPTSQNIYTYFSNTAGEKHKNISRDLLISNWMNSNSIEEITVKVSPINLKSSNLKKEKSLKKEVIKSISSDVEKQKDGILKKLKAKKDILSNKQIPKLLIIQCSDSKNPHGGISTHLDYNFGRELSEVGIKRKEYYKNLFISQPSHFVKKGENKSEYYLNALKSELKMPAINRYNGIFYRNDNRNNILTKIQGSNLHILIISGLYGLLRYDDQIIDYNLNIKKGPQNWYRDEIHNAVKEYMKKNMISNECVFYSLGIKDFNNSYYNALNPIREWTDLWIKNGRGHSTLDFIQNDFLSMI